MDVKEAVKVAREYAGQVFVGETIRLEEVWFDDLSDEWCVTVGLPRNEAGQSTGDILHGKRASRMHYKTVRIDDKTGSVKSVRNHDKMPVSPL